MEQVLLILHVVELIDLSPLQAIATAYELSMSETLAAISNSPGNSPHEHQDPTYFQTCLLQTGNRYLGRGNNFQAGFLVTNRNGTKSIIQNSVSYPACQAVVF